MVGKMAVDVNELNIDLASISSHKVGNAVVTIHQLHDVNQQAYLSDHNSNNCFYYVPDLWP
jgi:cysteine sulfinate desulfinase/cysteine desulfurase-like protein